MPVLRVRVKKAPLLEAGEETCEHCSWTGDVNKYERHLLLHSEDRKWVCNYQITRDDETTEYCNLRFSERHHLESHMRVHTGEKPYECPHCHKKFADRSNSLRHVKTHGLSEGNELLCNGVVMKSPVPRAKLVKSPTSPKKRSHKSAFNTPVRRKGKTRTKTLQVNTNRPTSPRVHAPSHPRSPLKRIRLMTTREDFNAAHDMMAMSFKRDPSPLIEHDSVPMKPKLSWLDEGLEHLVRSASPQGQKDFFSSPMKPRIMSPVPLNKVQQALSKSPVRAGNCSIWSEIQRQAFPRCFKGKTQLFM